MIDENYKNHSIFINLEKYSKFYELLSFSVFGFLTPGVSAQSNIDSYVFSSIQGTLDSISEILQKGRINDAYALLRKYHDSIIINIYSNLYLKDNLEAEGFVVKKINNWIDGTEKLPDYRVMSQYIHNQSAVSELTQAFYKDDIYAKLRDRCNDNTHYNFYHNVLLNDKDIHNGNSINLLNIFDQDCRNLFILHLGYLFYINGHYMASSDYVDFMDMGIAPPPDSQYEVAPFIQEVFNDVVKKNRPDISTLIKNTTYMRIK